MITKGIERDGGRVLSGWRVLRGGRKGEKRGERRGQAVDLAFILRDDGLRAKKR